MVYDIIVNIGDNMNENIKRLEEQINLLLEQYEHCKTINNARIILSSLQSLLDLYKEISDKEFIKRSELETRNPIYYQKYVAFNNHKRKLFINNFLQYKDFHYTFLCNIINQFDFFAYGSDLLYPQTHRKKELEQLLKEYCQYINSEAYSIYKMLQKDNCLFGISKKDDCCASIYSDYYNKADFIIFRNKKTTLENLVTLIHEIGHIEDFRNIGSSKLVDYTYRSPFSEVHSLKGKKEFYDYLLKSKIYADEIKDEVLFEPDMIIENLVSLITYCKTPSGYLDSSKYIFIKDSWIEEALQGTNLNPSFILDNFEILNFFDSYVYSYGELLSNYFLEYPKKYEAFRSRRYDFFHPRLFQDLEITSSDITKSLYKRYEKY